MAFDEVAGARADAIQALAAGLLKTAAAHAMTHGTDPDGEVIVAAGFAMAIREVGQDHPGISATIRAMLIRMNSR